MDSHIFDFIRVMIGTDGQIRRVEYNEDQNDETNYQDMVDKPFKVGDRVIITTMFDRFVANVKRVGKDYCRVSALRKRSDNTIFRFKNSYYNYQLKLHPTKIEDLL